MKKKVPSDGWQVTGDERFGKIRCLEIGLIDACSPTVNPENISLSTTGDLSFFFTSRDTRHPLLFPFIIWFQKSRWKGPGRLE